MKALNHVFVTMVQKDLTWFIPGWAADGRQQFRGSKMFAIELPPVDETPSLRTVPRMSFSSDARSKQPNHIV